MQKGSLTAINYKADETRLCSHCHNKMYNSNL